MKLRAALCTLLIAVASTLPGAAQTSLPETPPSLARALPSLIHAKQFASGPFDDAIDAAIKRDPDSAPEAVSVLSENLKDPNPDVQFQSLIFLSAIAFALPDRARLLGPALPEFPKILLSGNESSRKAVLYNIAILGKATPEALIPSLETLLASQAPDELRVGAVRVLMLARPSDQTVQNDVIAAMNDDHLPEITRQQMISAASVEGAGSGIINKVVQIANTSTNKALRDAAISGATEIGPSALIPIQARLEDIANNPAESLASHRIVHQALLDISKN